MDPRKAKELHQVAYTVKKVTVVPKDLPQMKKSCIVEMEFWDATEPIRSGIKVKTRIIKTGVLLKMISPAGISNIVHNLLHPVL
jgi:hypothetical protein